MNFSVALAGVDMSRLDLAGFRSARYLSEHVRVSLGQNVFQSSDPQGISRMISRVVRNTDSGMSFPEIDLSSKRKSDPIWVLHSRKVLVQP